MLQQLSNNCAQLMNLIHSGSITNIELAFQLAKSQNLTLDFSDYKMLYRWLDYFVEGSNDHRPKKMLEEIFKVETLNFSLSQQKRLPSSIGLLANIRVLILSLNNLSYLPKEISNLSRLVHLHLSYNKLKKLPANIKQLQQLKTLKLDSNRLEKFPLQILPIYSLEILNLAHNQIHTLPSNIEQLYNLKTLNLNDNPISNLPHSITHLEKLEHLILPLSHQNNPTTIEILKKIPNCKIQFGSSLCH